MAKIEFNPAQKAQLIEKLQRYFDLELEYDLGQFDADFLLDFIAKELGSVFYNQALYDAQAVLASRVDALSDALLELEQP